MQLSIEVFFEVDPSCGTDIAHMQNETLALRPVSLKPFHGSHSSIAGWTSIMEVALFLVSLCLVVVVDGQKSVRRTAYTHQEEMKVVQARTDGFVAETENVLWPFVRFPTNFLELSSYLDNLTKQNAKWDSATGMLNPFWMVKDRKMLFSHICTTFRRSWKLLLRKIQRLPPLMSSAQVFRLVGWCFGGTLWSSLLLVPDYYSGDFTWKLFHSKGSGDFGFATCSRRRGEAAFKVRQTNKFKKSLEIKKNLQKTQFFYIFSLLSGKMLVLDYFASFFLPTRFSPKKRGVSWNPGGHRIWDEIQFILTKPPLITVA